MCAISCTKWLITIETAESQSYIQAFRPFKTWSAVPAMSLNMDSHVQKWRHRGGNPHFMTAFDFCEIMASWCCCHSLLPLQSVIVFQLLGRKHTRIIETQASRKKKTAPCHVHCSLTLLCCCYVRLCSAKWQPGWWPWSKHCTLYWWAACQPFVHFTSSFATE